MDQNIELSDAGAPRTDEPRSDSQLSARRRQTILISLGCGVLQLPIWGVQLLETVSQLNQTGKLTQALTGMAMTFGVFQDAYTQQEVIKGPRSATGVIGTTMNGVMYISMPFLSTLLERSRWRSQKRSVAVTGTVLSAVSFLVSSWSTEVWHLIVLQGLLAALGNAMLYVPTTLWLDAWFREGNRATAYGVQFSIKNIIGTAGPFLMQSLLQNLGFRNALRVWAGIVLAVGLGGIWIVPRQQLLLQRRQQMMPWSFLKHRTFYIYALANAAFSSGYGLPQTYLPAYASQLLRLSAAQSTAMIAMFNAPGIISSTGFGLLSDKLHISGTTNTLISAGGSALCVFLFWAIKSNTLPGLLIAFAVGYGFFASGYSSTWGGWIKDLEKEAAEHNEAISSGMIYGFMNGARGIGYVAGGLSGVELLKLGPVIGDRGWALGTDYGALILFTGISSVLGGWGSVWKGCARVR